MANPPGAAVDVPVLGRPGCLLTIARRNPGNKASPRRGARIVMKAENRAVEQRRGVVRLLNTAGGRALCLAGEVDEATVEAHLRRYGREPMPVDVIDTGSVTRLSVPALDLVLDHLDAGERAGRVVLVRRSPAVERLLAL
jgi:hypothetical protein